MPTEDEDGGIARVLASLSPSFFSNSGGYRRGQPGGRQAGQVVGMVVLMIINSHFISPTLV
jgi:hypothetical protein